MSENVAQRKYSLLGAPFDLTSHTPGCALAPSALRTAGLDRRLRYLHRFGILAEDTGDVAFDNREVETESTDLRYREEFRRFGDALIDRLLSLYADDRTPFVIGGDHTISIGSVAAAAVHLRRTHGSSAKLGVIWVDAHPDLETPTTSRSGNIHGMAAAHLLGVGDDHLVGLGGMAPKVAFENFAYIGLRDAILAERTFLREHRITAYSMTDVEEFGIVRLCRDLFQRMAETTDGFVVSFDMDACDPLEAPGVQAPERGGLRFREARACFELASVAEKLLALELVELNPDLDFSGETVKAALALIEAGLGARPV